MTLFSLLHGQKIEKKKDSKRIPAEELSSLLSAKELVDTAAQDAIAYKKEVALECETIKEKAYEDGFAKGLEAFDAHLLQLDSELKALRKEVQEKILPLTLSAAKKILGQELHMHPERIVDIVLTSLKPVTQHKKVRIYVHKDDLAILEQHRPEIKKIFEHVESLSLEEREDIERGGCIIQTEAGIINAQLETQWRALEQAFQTFHNKQ